MDTNKLNFKYVAKNINKQTNFKNLYVHIPFCNSICHYCDFYKTLNNNNHMPFLEGIKKEIQFFKYLLDQNLDTVFLGGGTPSVLEEIQLSDFLNDLKKHISSKTEITIEANPLDISEEKCASWSRLGINRISLGVQSLNNETLKILGRRHKRNEAIVAINLIKKYFDNVSCDIIYAVPYLSSKTLHETISTLLDQEIRHISCYNLTLKPSNKLYSKLPNSDIAADHYNTISSILPKNWYQYEISNFCQSGFESRHNLNYWIGNSYLGIGPSAHSFDGTNIRWKNGSDLRCWNSSMNYQTNYIESIEKLSLVDQMNEFLYLNLRTYNGLHLKEFFQKFQINLWEMNQEFLRKCDSKRICQISDDTITLTNKGMLLLDEFFLSLKFQ